MLIYDGARALGPGEGLGRVRIVGLDEAVDFVPELLCAREDATVEGAALKLGEPALDCIEPGGTGRGEVEMEAWTLVEPGPDAGGLMRAAVVQDDVEIEFGVGLGVDLPQEGQELLGPMATGDAADDLARGDVEGGIEAPGSVPGIVMGPALDLSGPKREHGLCPVQCLDLGLLVDGEDHGVVRRIQIEPHNVLHFLSETGIVADLEGL